MQGINVPQASNFFFQDCCTHLLQCMIITFMGMLHNLSPL